MKTCTILLFIQGIRIALASSLPEESAFDDDSKIIGGTNAPHVPYMASLKMANNRHVCGGSIIAARWIVTAAHCLDNIAIAYVDVGSNILSRRYRRYRTSRQIMHSLYDKNMMNNDIGMLKTVTSIIFDRLVRPVNLALSMLPDRSAVTVYGWGLNRSIGGVIPDNLQQLQTTSMSIPRCRSMMPPGNRLFTTQFCTLTRTKGVCQGDSGGPVVFQGKLHGLVSWVVMPCASNYPDVHVNVFNFKTWIERIMATN